MKQFFIKKYIFAIIFLLILFGFGIFNAVNQFDEMKKTINKNSNIKKYDDIKKLIKKVENTTNSELLGKMYFIEAYGYTQELLGKKEIDNYKYIKDNNGFLYYASFYREKDESLKEYAKQIRRLKESVENKGTKTLFINTPEKYNKDYSDFNKGYPISDTNKIQDEFLMYLHNNRVDTLDLRNEILNSGLPYDKLFYKTDHHWTVEASFIGFSKIVDEMNSKYNANLDPEYFYRDINNYNQYSYPQSMLGSMGRNTGINFSGLDDFTLIVPKFKTNLVWEAKDLDGEKKYKKGSFDKSLLQMDLLTANKPYSISKYDTYIETINPWDKIVNKNNPKGPKILCIRDSYFSPTLSFMSSVCSEIHMIWPLATSNAVNIEDYIKKNDFDYILVELYPHNIKKEAFTFFKADNKK